MFESEIHNDIKYWSWTKNIKTTSHYFSRKDQPPTSVLIARGLIEPLRVIYHFKDKKLKTMRTYLLAAFFYFSLWFIKIRNFLKFLDKILTHKHHLSTYMKRNSFLYYYNRFFIYSTQVVKFIFKTHWKFKMSMTLLRFYKYRWIINLKHPRNSQFTKSLKNPKARGQIY